MKNKRIRYPIYLLSLLVILNATLAFAGRPTPKNNPPVAVASAAPQTSGLAPLTIQFTGSGSYDPDGTIVSYSWDFGDGGTSILTDPLYTYQGVGSYNATLTVTDDGGATDVSSPIAITVEIQIPKIIRFQGILKDTNGTPISGQASLTFRIYDVETLGTPLWEEVQSGINLVNGVLDVELGNITSIDLSFDRQYWLGVQIDPDLDEMVPRFKLTTVPYAFSSER